MNSTKQMPFTFDFRETFLKISGLNVMSNCVVLLLVIRILSFNYSLSFTSQNHTKVDSRHEMLKKTGSPRPTKGLTRSTSMIGGEIYL
jgi:hypothetical protein